MLYFEYKVYFYVLPSGRWPVLDYLRELQKEERWEIDRHLEHLRKREGKLLPPQAKHILGKIWELRIKINERQHRIFYFIAPLRKIVLLSAFIKKTKKTPRKEIIKAQKYYFDYMNCL